MIFDEHVFPFSQLHDHAGARLKAEVKCLHPSLLNSDYGGEQVDDQYTNRPRDIANNVVEFAEQELHPSVQQDSGGDVLPHVPPGSEHEVDSPGLQHTESAPPSASSDESGGGRSQSAPCGESGGGRCAAPVRGDPTRAATESEDATCAPGPSTMPRNLRLSSEGKQDPNSEVQSTAPATTNTNRPRTRLQDGIRKEKKYTDGTVKYGFLTSTGEPTSTEEALGDKNWQAAMNA